MARAALPALVGALLLLTPSLGRVSVTGESSPDESFDIVIRGGAVVDGSGAPAVRTDVGIRDGRIAALGDLSDAEGKRSIAADGALVTPGFIDLHSHADAGLSDPHLAQAHNLVAQGITTTVVGQDSWHAWPVGTTLEQEATRWRAHGIGLNVVPLAGYLAVRREIMGWSREPPTEEQYEAIAAKIYGYLEQGAWGLTSGIEFTPYVTVEEIVRALAPVREADGIYMSHLRSQREVPPAIDEFLETVRAAEVTGVVSHLKIVGPEHWGSAEAAVEKLRVARTQGLRVFADHTPYWNGAGGIDVELVPESALLSERERDETLPPGVGPSGRLLAWGFERQDLVVGHWYTLDFLLAQDEEQVRRMAESFVGSLVRSEALIRRRLRGMLSDPTRAGSMLTEVEARIASHGGPGFVYAFGHPEPSTNGRTLDEVAALRGVTPARAAAELTLEGAMFVTRQHSDEDTRTIVTQPFVAASAEGWIAEYGQGSQHPRVYGAFVRRLERYVVDREWLDWSTAIHGATGLAAEILGLADRGRIAEGYWADLVVLDPQRIRDRATFEQPHRYPAGIEWVLVNGEPAVQEGRLTGLRPGRVLRR